MSTNYSELRKILNNSGWPAHAIAKSARVPETVVKDYLADTKEISPLDFGRIQAWSENHIGITPATGKIIFTKWRGDDLKMPDLSIMPPVMPGRAPEFEPNISVVDADKTLAAQANYLNGAMTGSEIKIRAENVIAKKQVVREGEGA
ncbi:hypothetical protein EJ069_10300 [Mesorhizobium sp. M2A.F.Ca.ET.043.05.1.1]|uniref:hypothetical protein n=1 Tax=Mesorhizobium sp. M2A.F.Ca.ET.043.05.1.1 TaxID=2493671 RepID=UPI000F74D806|nr:hypothetical protein [Mesorhizobium sp. M2A.F.Ca.ET.043.05.1.1]AZO15085.1 hypothetical protein EJ069_10300 [Mesorhizobium sp. M2A.F.Ca.ET.043.05.1.1]